MLAHVVDSSKQPMVATGVVDARFDWVEVPCGGRRPSEQQTGGLVENWFADAIAAPTPGQGVRRPSTSGTSASSSEAA